MNIERIINIVVKCGIFAFVGGVITFVSAYLFRWWDEMFSDKFKEPKEWKEQDKRIEEEFRSRGIRRK